MDVALRDGQVGRSSGAPSGGAGRPGAEPEPLDCEGSFRLLAELTGQVVYDWDLASSHVRWGGAVAKVTGWAPEEQQDVNAARWQERIHPDDRDAVLGALEQARRDCAPYGIEYRLRCKDGSYRRVEDRGAFLPDASGQAARVLGALIDVSRRWELEQQLVQAQKMEAVGQLAGGVAHDFNNIIAIIICYAEQALRESGPAAPESRALNQILKAGGRAATLTRQLLAFSRKETACPVNVNLSSLVKDALAMLRRLIGEDIELKTELEPDLGEVFVDPGHIEQILMNLAANARDAMPGGGTLTIKTANAPATNGKEGARTGTWRVLLQVRDTGQGMPPEIIPHVFEPFFTTKPEGHGTGLGLATVGGIVQQSGGEIDLESAVGVGTAFSLHFPIVERGSQSGAEAVRPAGVGGSETILLVEDEVALLQILRDGLANRGYTVLAASGGQQALELSRRHAGTIDLVLTDIIMPGMSGYEMVSRLVVERPGLHVLYMSGYTADFIARKGLRIDGAELLPKPFTEETLQARIRVLLDQ
jgi:two-component system cell cycle sensor histidine kinase/response regulator CckA